MSDWEPPKLLRLVTDGTDPPPARPTHRVSHGLTPEQRGRLASVLRNLRLRYGTHAKVAEALGVSSDSVCKTANVRPHRGSVTMAARAAHLAGIAIGTIMYGAVSEAGRCGQCGQPLPVGSDVQGHE